MVSADISKERRKEVYARDGYVCALCGSHQYLQIHHVIPRSQGGSDFPENLITLCSKCHGQAHGVDCTSPRDYLSLERWHTPYGIYQVCDLAAHQLEELGFRCVHLVGPNQAIMKKGSRSYGARINIAHEPALITPASVEQACVEYVSDYYAGDWYPFK